VATLLVERFAPAVGARDNRVRAYCDERVGDGLAGRTIWCTPELHDRLGRLLRDRASVRSYEEARVGQDDLVVMDERDPLAQEVRERGAHAVVRVRAMPGRPAAAVDAYLYVWSARGAFACRVAAVMPRAGRVAEKDMRAADDDLAWGSLLADIVGTDREERVGGRRGARPAVAVH
jgi:hypothetical protein